MTLERTFHWRESRVGADLHLNEVGMDQQPSDSQPFYSDQISLPSHAAHARPTLRQHSGCYDTHTHTYARSFAILKMLLSQSYRCHKRSSKQRMKHETSWIIPETCQTMNGTFCSVSTRHLCEITFTVAHWCKINLVHDMHKKCIFITQVMHLKWINHKY